MTPVKKEKDEGRPDIIQQTTRVLGLFGGGAILFYVESDDMSKCRNKQNGA